MNKWVSIGISGVLLVALVATGVLYMGKSNDLKTAKNEIATQKTTIESLNKDLTASKGETTDFKAKLAASEATVVTLNGNISDLTGKNTKLTADLGTANTQLTSTQASLSSANSALSTAQSTNSSLTATVKKVTDPKHFTSATELKDWLQKDDTNTKYATSGAAQRAFILQVRALRDGYLLPTGYYETSSGVIFYNLAIIEGTCYVVLAANDSIYADVSIQPLPSHPEPLP